MGDWEAAIREVEHKWKTKWTSVEETEEWSSVLNTPEFSSLK